MIATFNIVNTSWNSPGFLDSEVIEKRDQHGGSDGDELPITGGERPRDDGVGEEGENGEGPEDADQAGGNSRNGSRFGDEECCPRIEETRERTVTIANIDIFSTGLRLHRTQFGISECAEK